MLFTNQYSFNLTGTNFGLLNQYERADYINSYFFSDLFGNNNFNYPLSTYGGVFYERYTDSDIENLSNLQVWLDASDSSTVTVSSNPGGQEHRVISILDKTANQYLFERIASNNVMLTAFWPVNSDYRLLEQEYIDTNYRYLSGFNKCINFLGNNYLSCSSVTVDVFKPFSLYFVWKNNYILDISGENKERTIPFSFITNNQGVSSELLPVLSIDNSPNVSIGTRDSLYGFKVDSLSGYNTNFNTPNILEYVIDGTFVNELSSQKLLTNNLLLCGDSTFLTPDFFNKIYTTTVGYSGDSNTNNFYFCEMLVFDRMLNESERGMLLNTLFYKWTIDELIENITFGSGVLSGGFLKNISYEDFSLLTSVFEVPVQSCVTQLTISLSAFDESTSKIKKILYTYNDVYGELDTLVYDVLQPNNTYSYLEDRNIKVLLKPSDTKFFDSYIVKLSAVRYDGTINKVNVIGNITQCSLRDLYSDSYLVDSQIVDNLNQNIIVLENKGSKQLHLNKIDVNIDNIYLSGGDFVELKNEEADTGEEVILTLAEIFDEVVVSKPVYKIPFIKQPVKIDINPIRPT